LVNTKQIWNFPYYELTIFSFYINYPCWLIIISNFTFIIILDGYLLLYRIQCFIIKEYQDKYGYLYNISAIIDIIYKIIADNIK